jgi:hypothetical protein
MLNAKSMTDRGTRWRSVFVAAVATIATLWSSAAMATITQGDFSVFGFFESREEGRWGEGSSNDNSTPTKFVNVAPAVTEAFPGKPASTNGGSFEFNHWDLVEARQLGDIRPDYHMVKNYKFLGRFDTLFLKDADFFAFYRPWYDAYGTLKNKGRAKPGTDRHNYTHYQLQQQFFRNDLREYYAQLNFTDNFSMRVGKQQVIWSEADALSGTDVTNPVDASFHGVYGAESPEDTRRNIRMVKFNYILPDMFKTANNEIEAFWIPGDFQGSGIRVATDPRNPWVAPAVLGKNFPLNINQNGQAINADTLPMTDSHAMLYLAPLTSFADVDLGSKSKTPSNSLQNSEFGTRISSLLPIGNGLQMSFIYLYEFRDSLSGACTGCTAADAARIWNAQHPKDPISSAVPIFAAAGQYIIPGHFMQGPPRPGVPKIGSFLIISQTDYMRNHFFDLTGTYYDKDLTDIVYRYDVLYQPHHAVGTTATATGSKYTELTRWIVAGDRPTYIPWLSKQHTFITAQYVLTWEPDRPSNASSIVVPGLPGVGKNREIGNFAFLAFTNWLMNGQLTAGNVFQWDIDDSCGAFTTSNSYRYSRNVLFGVNAQWFLGRSGRITDPFLYSRQQRFNDLEFTLTYEI